MLILYLTGERPIQEANYLPGFPDSHSIALPAVSKFMLVPLAGFEKYAETSETPW